MPTVTDLYWRHREYGGLLVHEAGGHGSPSLAMVAGREDSWRASAVQSLWETISNMKELVVAATE